MLTDVATGLATQGRNVRVITSAMTYEDASIRLPSRENIAGVQVARVPTTRFGRASFIGRAFDYISFYLSSFFRVLMDARRGDIVIMKTDPSLLSVPLGLAARLRGARTVNWLQDKFPETAAALGVGLASGMTGHVSVAARNRSLKRADRNVVIGQRMAEGAIGRIVRANRFGAVVPVGAAETLAARIRSWQTSPDLVLQMGRNARAYLDEQATRSQAIGQWADLLEELSNDAL